METKTYQGRTLEEILPRIKRELGPDAVVLRQRTGLTGGVGGFFQRECVEVEARPPERRFDAYDDDEAATPPAVEPEFTPDPLPPDLATSEGLSSRAIQAMLDQAAPFADDTHALADMGADAIAANRAAEDSAVVAERASAFAEHLSQAERSAPLGSPPGVSSSSPHPKVGAAGEALERALVAAGIDAALAERIVAETVSHLLPFASPRSLKRLVRAALAREIPVEPGASAGPRALAFVGTGGAGKTLCAARVAAAYAAANQQRAVCVALRAADGGAELHALLEPFDVSVIYAQTGEQARALLEPVAERSIAVIDTPAAAAGDRQAIDALARDLSAIGLDEVHLALPTSFSSPAARDLIERLAPVATSRLTLTHVDESSHPGGAIDAAIASRTPVSFVSSGVGVADGIEPADADALAAMVLR